jgi:F-type H+/Na+-transporting ATPase subunit alpha
LEAFAKFGSDLDAATQRQLRRGERTVELMKQGEYQPLAVENQIALLKVNAEGLLDKLPVEAISNFEENYLQTINAKYDKEMRNLGETGVLDDQFGNELLKTARTIMDQLTATETEEA